MNKKFDAVKFQRERRTELSRKLAKMTPSEMIEYFERVSLPPRSKKKKRATHA